MDIKENLSNLHGKIGSYAFADGKIYADLPPDIDLSQCVGIVVEKLGLRQCSIEKHVFSLPCDERIRLADGLWKHSPYLDSYRKNLLLQRQKHLHTNCGKYLVIGLDEATLSFHKALAFCSRYAHKWDRYGNGFLADFMTWKRVLSYKTVLNHTLASLIENPNFHAKATLIKGTYWSATYDPIAKQSAIVVDSEKFVQSALATCQKASARPFFIYEENFGVHAVMF